MHSAGFKSMTPLSTLFLQGKELPIEQDFTGYSQQKLELYKA